jgi:hypothetical protein
MELEIRARIRQVTVSNRPMRLFKKEECAAEGKKQTGRIRQMTVKGR